MERNIERRQPPTKLTLKKNGDKGDGSVSGITMMNPTVGLNMPEKTCGDGLVEGLENEDKVNLEDSKEDLLSSQELKELARNVGVNIADFQEDENEEKEEENLPQEEPAVLKNKKGKQKMEDHIEGGFFSNAQENYISLY
jgi:hypothetical protein